MAASFEIRAEGLGETQRQLDAMVRRGVDLSPLMARIGAYVEGSTIQRFQDQRAPDGARWEPSLRAKLQGGQTLVDTARLRNSITHHANRTSAAVGSNTIYAGIHQGGGTIRAKGGGRLKFKIPGIGFRSVEEVVIPARPFLGLDSDDRDEIEGLTGDYLLEGRT